ncbi:MAG: VOC family protein [Pseudomonadota bacterium]
MTNLNPYLTFDGNCRESFEFYRSVFGGEFTDFNTFGDGPPEMEVKEGDRDKVMHVSLPVGSTVLMGSDSAEGYGLPPTVGTNFSISIAGDDTAEADRLFAALSDSGSVGMPMQDTFWNAYFGMCRDRFGINWMINVDKGSG